MVNGDARDQCVHVVFSSHERFFNARGGILNWPRQVLRRALRDGGPRHGSDANRDEACESILGTHRVDNAMSLQPFWLRV